MQLAQVNVALLRAPLASEEMREFVGALGRINRLAKRSPGFVWRLSTEDQHGVSVITEEGKLVFVNVSVWTHYEPLHMFVYRSAHAASSEGARSGSTRRPSRPPPCGGSGTAISPRCPTPCAVCATYASGARRHAHSHSCGVSIPTAQPCAKDLHMPRTASAPKVAASHGRAEE